LRRGAADRLGGSRLVFAGRTLCAHMQGVSLLAAESLESRRLIAAVPG